jgi:hypothetical protein
MAAASVEFSSSESNDLLNYCVSVPPPGTPLGYHAPGYELFPGVGYYKFHTTPKTWDEARQICQQEGGYLVVINSEAESKVMQSFLDGARNIKGANHNDYAFVGFHDRFVEGEYLTVFGKTAPLLSACISDTHDFRSSLR